MTSLEKVVYYRIVNYLSAANLANALLSEVLGANPWHLWKARKVAQTGSPGGNVLSYAFHGVGCAIKTNDFSVDFDYSMDGAIRTFNSYVVQNHMTKELLEPTARDFETAYEI